ncbi:MAG: YjbQ family protein [Ignavibacteriaceae bacterium]|nr:YjbQ family protein [Ignavibacteriaceae bacterium]
MEARVKTEYFVVESRGNTDILDITEKIQEILSREKFLEGSALIFISGSTAGITTMEYEPGLLTDYPEFFERMIPSSKNYHHDKTWHDGNGHSHIRASLQGASLTVPFKDGKLLLGNWQQIILVDFDNRPRSRKVIVQLNGLVSTN